LSSLDFKSGGAPPPPVSKQNFCWKGESFIGGGKAPPGLFYTS